MLEWLNAPAACVFIALAMMLVAELGIVLHEREVDEEEIANEWNSSED